MSVISKTGLLKMLRRKGFRDSFVASNFRNGFADQVRALREQRGWAQSELGAAAGKPQSVISRLEDPEYGKITAQSALDLAHAFDLPVVLRYPTWEEYLNGIIDDLSPEAMMAEPFEAAIDALTKSVAKDEARAARARAKAATPRGTLSSARSTSGQLPLFDEGTAALLKVGASTLETADVVEPRIEDTGNVVPFRPRRALAVDASGYTAIGAKR